MHTNALESDADETLHVIGARSYLSLGLNFHVACYFHVGQKHNARLLATRGSAACARSRRRCCGTPQALAMVERMVRIGQAVRLQHIMQYRERRRAV
jgi:hypothetical protein